MHCAEFESRFHQLLDARVAPECDRRLLAHSAECAACRQMLQAQQTLFAGLDAFDPPATSRDFAQQVVLRRRAPKKRFSTAALAIAAMAAAVLLTAALMNGGFGGPVNPAKQPTTGLPVAIGNSHRSIASSPAANDAAAQIATEEYRAILHTFLEDLPSATDRIPAVDHLAGGLKPIASSFSAALDALRRTIPGARANPNSDKPQAGVIYSHWPKYTA